MAPTCRLQYNALRSHMRRLVLFDVDNTLLYSGGAGSLAMKRAFREVFSIQDGFRNVEFSGRTDTAILRDALVQHGLLRSFEEGLERFKKAYFQHLPATLREVEGRVMAGVCDLLTALEAQRQVGLGLSTGNFRQGAMMKLAYYGLDPFFADGGFGEDAEDRALVVKLAIERMAGGDPLPEGNRSVFVVGDTPLDIASARANGAQALAVATGRHSLEELRAAGADLLFPDLSDTPEVLAAILS
jgi:phosphoglycolate phosphatase